MPHATSWQRKLLRLASALTPRLALPPSQAARPEKVAPPQQEAREQPPVADKTVTHTSSSMARGLGLTLHQDRDRVERTGHTLSLPAPPAIEPADVNERAKIAAELLAARFLLDHRQVEWAPELERPTASDKAYQKKDIPSAYGDRMPRLVPTRTRELLEEWLEEELLFEPFLQQFDVIFVLEIGKYQHIMTHEAARATNLAPERVSQDARYTLFYQSYKIRPERETHPWGKSRHYLTREGLGATRALMLPDFDIQAAREQGFAAIVSRDELLTVEPHTPEDRDAARAWCQDRADTLRETARYPYIAPLIELTPP